MQTGKSDPDCQDHTGVGETLRRTVQNPTCARWSHQVRDIKAIVSQTPPKSSPLTYRHHEDLRRYFQWPKDLPWQGSFPWTFTVAIAIAIGLHVHDLMLQCLQGKLYIRGDNKIFRFQNGKSESLFLQRKNPRRIAWTVLFRRQHRKGISEVGHTIALYLMEQDCGHGLGTMK